jgi:hypothetical protein
MLASRAFDRVKIGREERFATLARSNNFMPPRKCRSKDVCGAKHFAKLSLAPIKF